jgi:hypothetical protein
MVVAQPFEAHEPDLPPVQTDLAVKVLLNGRVVAARAQQVSMAGLTLWGDPTLGRNRLTLSIPLPKDREIVAQCSVVRRDSASVSVEFEHLDWDHLLALARFVHPLLP